MSTKDIKTMTKKSVIEKFAKNDKDTGSTEVQIAVISQRISKLTEHFNSYSKDNTSKRGLLRLIGRRKRLLKYLEKVSPDRFKACIKELGIR